MNPVYFRVALYMLAPMLAMLPGVTYDPIAQTVLISLDTVAIGLAGGAAIAGGVFMQWGKS